MLCLLQFYLHSTSARICERGCHRFWRLTFPCENLLRTHMCEYDIFYSVLNYYKRCAYYSNSTKVGWKYAEVSLCDMCCGKFVNVRVAEIGYLFTIVHARALWKMLYFPCFTLVFFCCSQNLIKMTKMKKYKI